MSITHDTDTTALANEELNAQGADAYHDATVAQLAEFFDTHADLWEPAGEDYAWEALDGFDEALARFIDGQ